MSKKKKTVFAKPQLCQEFGVTERTLNYLTELELIAPDWTYRHGLPIVELTEDDRLTLSCAGNAIHNNLRGRLPFQRFLYLRFIQMPLEYIQFELAEKNLMDAARVTPTETGLPRPKRRRPCLTSSWTCARSASPTSILSGTKRSHS